MNARERVHEGGEGDWEEKTEQHIDKPSDVKRKWGLNSNGLRRTNTVTQTSFETSAIVMYSAEV